MFEALKALRGLTLYEKYVLLVIIGIWMDTYLKTQEDIAWAEEQITRMEKESGQLLPSHEQAP
jgi:hypothetical protein